eukprot:m.51026 g.51026  ORF g.51026 m.51026 type:complete len:73 (+) comp10925_c0_seq3:97-315(+)
MLLLTHLFRLSHTSTSLFIVLFSLFLSLLFKLIHLFYNLFLFFSIFICYSQFGNKLSTHHVIQAAARTSDGV